jgi:hypothetical protein
MKTNNKKSIIEEAKIELEELEELLKKGGEEFKEAYKQKKHKIVGIIKKYIKELEESGEDKMLHVMESTDELLNLLEADYDLSYTEYEDESHKIAKAIDTFEKKASEIFVNLSSDVKHTKSKIEEELSLNLEKFKTEMDIQKAHFKGTKERAMSEFESWKKNRLIEIEKLKQDLETKKKTSEGKIEKFNEEISVSFDHLKNAFKNLW